MKACEQIILHDIYMSSQQINISRMSVQVPRLGHPFAGMP
jgi:hypothetical protein